MSDADFQVKPVKRGTKQSVPVIFEEEKFLEDYYIYNKILEEEAEYEQLMLLDYE